MADRWQNLRGFKGYWDQGWPAKRPSWGLIELLLVFVLVLVLLITLRLWGSSWLVPLANNLFPGYRSNLSLLLLLALVQDLLMSGLVLATAGLKDPHPLKSLGLQGCKWRSIWLYGIMGGIAVFMITAIVLALISTFWHLQLPLQKVAYLIGRTNGWREQLGSMLISCILAPLSEELYFRGFFYPVFRSRLGLWPGVLITSCFFAVLHYDQVRFLPIALGGAFFAISCEKTRSLYPAIVAHSIWNTLTTLVILFAGNLS